MWWPQRGGDSKLKVNWDECTVEELRRTLKEGWCEAPVPGSKPIKWFRHDLTGKDRRIINKIIKQRK